VLVEHCLPTFEQVSESLSMLIQLTDELRFTLDSERGPTQTNLFELRGASRFRCCGKCVGTLSPDSFQMPGQAAKSLMIVRDISRKGIGLISHQQWYPEQQLNLLLENATVEARVARVRRVGPYCFEVGLIIAKHELNG
jgi:hypothetical protein